MGKWTWLLPCWVWLWWFRYIGKSLMDVGGERCQSVRLNDEFILVRYPTARFCEPPKDRKRRERLRKIEDEMARAQETLDRLGDQYNAVKEGR